MYKPLKGCPICGSLSAPLIYEIGFPLNVKITPWDHVRVGGDQIFLLLFARRSKKGNVVVRFG